MGAIAYRDYSYTRMFNRSAVGVCIQYVSAGRVSNPILDLGFETDCENEYEAQVLAAARAVQECVQLYTKIYLAVFPGGLKSTSTHA